MGLISRQFGVGLLFTALLLSFACDGFGAMYQDFSRYQVILEREPFGKLLPPVVRQVAPPRNRLMNIAWR